MNNKFEKANLVVIIFLILILLNVNVKKSEIPKIVADGFHSTFYTILDFMRTNNYNGEDITELEHIKEENINTLKFVLKKDIICSTSFNLDRMTQENIVIAKEESYIEDLINCANLFSYEDRDKNYNIFKGSINEALKNKGRKIEVPLSDNNYNKESYVQVLDGMIYIVISF
ncbi:hypothetical protein NE686_17925 [Tissierella carlieri]|uniref:Uncharacterized protein n=1 Tax=Tissierella carlieri TaxID=689904 RepID=A0ABT1SES7_9FIRM|nr:hypothetical protein [Tissierella carlieri]MCQ4924984.1 hypothetical protein [Tissierella carlieri]